MGCTREVRFTCQCSVVCSQAARGASGATHRHALEWIAAKTTINTSVSGTISKSLLMDSRCNNYFSVGSNWVVAMFLSMTFERPNCASGSETIRQFDNSSFGVNLWKYLFFSITNKNLITRKLYLIPSSTVYFAKSCPNLTFEGNIQKLCHLNRIA